MLQHTSRTQFQANKLSVNTQTLSFTLHSASPSFETEYLTACHHLIAVTFSVSVAHTYLALASES